MSIQRLTHASAARRTKPNALRRLWDWLHYDGWCAAWRNPFCDDCTETYACPECYALDPDAIDRALLFETRPLRRFLGLFASPFRRDWIRAKIIHSLKTAYRFAKHRIRPGRCNVQGCDGAIERRPLSYFRLYPDFAWVWCDRCVQEWCYWEHERCNQYELYECDDDPPYDYPDCYA